MEHFLSNEKRAWRYLDNVPAASFSRMGTSDGLPLGVEVDGALAVEVGGSPHGLLVSGEGEHGFYVVAIDVGAMKAKKLLPQDALDSKHVCKAFLCSRRVPVPGTSQRQLLEMQVRPH